jgi:hypothetical protein
MLLPILRISNEKEKEKDSTVSHSLYIVVRDYCVINYFRQPFVLESGLCEAPWTARLDPCLAALTLSRHWPDPGQRGTCSRV